MDTITGTVERVTFHNAENGYTVLRLRPDRRANLPGVSREGLVTATGNLPDLQPGEYLTLEGSWEKHALYGLQFKVEHLEQSLPATVDGITRYLGSGLIKGIGARLAERIVQKFGARTFDVIETQPEQLLQVADIGERRVGQIVAAWQEQKYVKEIMLYLYSHGVSTNLAVKIYKQYGNQALQVVKTDPYRLARDIYGVGFKTADRLAQALGLPADHPSRIEAGLVYMLNQMSGEGHVFAPEETLVARAVELLEVDARLVLPGIGRLHSQDRVRLDWLPIGAPPEDGDAPALVNAVYLTPFHIAETGVAERLKQLTSVEPLFASVLQDHLPGTDPVSLLAGNLSEQQLGAVSTALTSPISVLTGGPGTGKTTTVRSLITVLEAYHKKYALASPTGRAAKRLSESTGRPASTIHRLLGYGPEQGFQYNVENPLPIDFLVVDEASMLDILLAHHLLKAIRPGTHVLIVGDVDQLPSVGAGDVLRDIIAGDLVPVTRLTQIYRQAQDSQIITNAHRINQGLTPSFEPGSRDFFLFPADSPETAAGWVEQVVCERIPAKFGLRIEQIQVLAPMYRGPAGVDALNGRLQQAINPPASGKGEYTLFGQLFRVGDRVMQTQNNYDKEVFNGDIGRVQGIDLVEHTLTIDYDNRMVMYDWSEADQLILAYAISVHKAQGSEFPAVVIPLVAQHYMMLQRNLLYTAVTRARQLCVIVGERRAISMAARNNKVSVRYTGLDLRLRDR